MENDLRVSGGERSVMRSMSAPLLSTYIKHIYNQSKLPAKIHPADHMSIEVVYTCAPIRTSGGRYHNVTTCNITTLPMTRVSSEIVIQTNHLLL